MKRAALLLLLGAAAVFAVVRPAHASAPVDAQAWSRTGAVPTFVADVDHLYVAADVGSESARSYVHIEMSKLPDGVDTGMVLHFEEAEDPSALVEGATVGACPLTTPIVGRGEVSAETAPSVDCANAVPVVRAADGSWTVALDRFVPEWRNGDDLGLALVATASGTTTFRVALDPAKTFVALPAVETIAPGASTATSATPTAPTNPLPPMVGAGSAPTLTPEMGIAPEVNDTAPAAVSAVPEPAAAFRVGSVRVATPPAWLVLSIVGLVGLGTSVPLGRRRQSAAAAPHRIPTAAAGWTATAAVVVLAPTVLAETTVYKIGLVLILLVGAIGLHLLVSWAGELSLAHATLVGLPAFAVAKLSADHGLSPILLLPVGVAVGLAAGAAIGVPAIRARGLQVALVTLAAGVAIDRFFFTKEWLVGTVSSEPVATPSLGPITFATSRSMYPFLALVAVVSVLAAWAIYRSKVGRALLWIKAQPDAAAAFGIPVARYRVMAYGLAGGFAGLAGGLTTMWVQRLTPEAFPLSRSFTYLIIVALAGRGFIGGVALAAAMIEGGQLFLASGDAFITYAAPIGLVLTLTKHPVGLNGFGRSLATRMRAIRTGGNSAMTNESTGVRALLAAGTVSIAIGFASIVLAWYHAGNTREVWIQNQEMILGGIGGLGLVIVGVGIVIYDRLLAARAADAERWERVLSVMESTTAERDEAMRPRRRRPVSA